MALFVFLLSACGTPCGPGTHEEGGVCAPDEHARDTSDSASDSGADTDTGTDSDPDDDTEPDTGDETDTDTDTDPGPCTVALDGSAQWTSIQDALDDADDGDVITVCSGTYVESIRDVRPLTILGESGDASDVILQGDGTGTVVSLLAGGTVTLAHLTIRGGGGDVAAILADTTDLILEDIVVTENDGTVVIAERSGTFTADGLDVYDNVGTILLDLEGDTELTHVQVHENQIVSDGRRYLSLWLGGPGSGEIYNSLFYGDTSDRPTSYLVTDLDQLRIQNTVFILNDAMAVAGSGSNYLRSDAVVSLTIENVVVEGTGVSGAYAFATVNGGSLTTEYSDFHQATTNSTSGTGTCIDVDPGFADAAGHDYTLDRFSSLVDAGNPGSAFSDADGTRNDIGAFGGPDGDWLP